MSGSGRRLKFRYVVVLAVLAWAAYYYWHVQHRALVALTVQSGALQSQLLAAEKQHASLQTTALEFQNPTYIERYAAEHFSLILPNQISFTVQKSK